MAPTGFGAVLGFERERESDGDGVRVRVIAFFISIVIQLICFLNFVVTLRYGGRHLRPR